MSLDTPTISAPHPLTNALKRFKTALEIIRQQEQALFKKTMSDIDAVKKDIKEDSIRKRLKRL